MQVYSIHRLLQYKVYQSVVVYQSQYHNAIYQSQYSELLNIEIGLQVVLQQAVVTQQSPTQVGSSLQGSKYTAISNAGSLAYTLCISRKYVHYSTQWRSESLHFLQYSLCYN